MTPDIRSKLNDCIGEKNYSERDVVYFLVQGYKLLERENKKDNFPVIKFYRNWACHAVLYGYREIFKSVIEENKNGFGSFGNIDLAADQIRESFRNFSPKKLEEEAKNVITQFLAPYLQNTNTLNWDKFRKQLYEVIKNIPVTVKEDDKEIFRFECLEVLNGINFDDLRITVTMGNVNFDFNLDDKTL